MKRKLSLLLAMVLAMTMVMGISVSAFAEEYTEPKADDSYGDGITWSDIHSATIPMDQGNGWTKDLIIYYADFADSDTGYELICWFEGQWRARDEYSSAILDELKGLPMNIINEEVMEPGSLAIFWKEATAPDPAPNTPSPSAHVHSFTWQTITEPTQYADGLEGEVCSCGATRNTQPLSAYGYTLNDYATPMINAAKAGQAITFEFGEWNSFPKSFMAKLVDKSAQNVTFVFHYKWNHVKQEITIPAGTPIDLNFDWYGPAKMAELYGAN